MPLRIYIAPQIGSGMLLSYNPKTWSDTTGPWRSLLHNFVNTANGDRFDEIDHPARRISIVTLEAEVAVHDAIDADSRIVPVIPLRATDRLHLKQILEAPFSSYPLAWRTAARTKLESWGVNTEWITGSNMMKDVIRQVVKIFSVAQMADGQGQTNAIEFLKGNLDVQVSAIPTAQRTAIGTWLQGKGIDTTWITGTTTVRQVVASLPASIGKLYGREVTHRFAGEDL